MSSTSEAVLSSYQYSPSVSLTVADTRITRWCLVRVSFISMLDASLSDRMGNVGIYWIVCKLGTSKPPLCFLVDGSKQMSTLCCVVLGEWCANGWSVSSWHLGRADMELSQCRHPLPRSCRLLFFW